MGPTGAEACSVLFDQAFADIWRYLRRRVASSHDADDLAADVFAVAWRRWDDRPVRDRELRLWLYGIARNVILNHHRSSGRRRRLETKLEGRRPSEPVDPSERSEPGLYEALRRLSPSDRDLLLMRAWDGLAVTEMAMVLGCSPNAASIRLHKARSRLRHQLDLTSRRKESPLDGHERPNPAAERSTP